MQLLITMLTSSSLKYVSILLILVSLLGTVYFYHKRYVELEKQATLYEYNMRQLQQTLDDTKKFLNQLQEIDKVKSDLIQQFYKEKQQIDDKAKEAEIEVEKDIVKGKDRESSEVLKDTFRKLSDQ